MKILFFLLVIFSAAENFPQSVDTIKADIMTFLNTGKEIITAPASFDEYDYIKLGGVLLAVTGGFYADNEVKDFSQRNLNNFNKHLFNIDRYYYVPGAVALTAGTYFYGYFSENDELRRLGIDLGEAAFYSGAINILLKFASGRHRPLRTDDNTVFDPFERSPRYSAFGSAHTTLAFAISVVMADYSDNFIWKTAWFSAAGLVGAARIYYNMHWFSDVLLGGSIGYFIGSYVLDKKENLELAVIPGGISFRLAIQ